MLGSSQHHLGLWSQALSFFKMMGKARQQHPTPFFMEIFMLGAWLIRKQRNDYIFNWGRPSLQSWKLGFLQEASLQAHRMQPENNSFSQVFWVFTDSSFCFLFFYWPLHCPLGPLDIFSPLFIYNKITQQGFLCCTYFKKTWYIYTCSVNDIKVRITKLKYLYYKGGINSMAPGFHKQREKALSTHLNTKKGILHWFLPYWSDQINQNVVNMNFDHSRTGTRLFLIHWTKKRNHTEIKGSSNTTYLLVTAINITAGLAK